jgi:hypothetical protein
MIGLDYIQIKQVGEHQIKMPTLSALNKEDILFINEKDAYWRRELLIKEYKQIWFDFIPYKTKVYEAATLYDNNGLLVSLNKEDSDWFLKILAREMHRREHGVFMKNKNDIVWITGDHYFTLMWCKTKRPDKKGDWFDYREFQADHFYLVKHTNSSDLISGLFVSKAKKTGITNLMWMYYLNKYTRTKNINGSNMNIDQQKGAKTFRDHFIYAYNGLPMIFKPQWKSKSEMDGIIVFGKRYSNSAKNMLIQNDAADELNTTVMCVPAMIHTLDIDVFEDTWYDEPPKYKSDFGEIYRSNSSATSLQDFRVGKDWFTSYTPEDSGASFIAAREIFFNSELSTITDRSNGQTKSKAICHHIPAYASWTTSFDKYGKCDEADAMRKIQFGRDNLKGRPREMAAEVRKYANTKKEAWSTGGAGSVFDNLRLGDLLADLEKDQRDSPDGGYKEFDLLWSREDWNILRSKRRKGEFAQLKYIPVSEDKKEKGIHGKYRQYHHFNYSLENLTLKQGRDEMGNLLAPREYSGVLGIDPTQYASGSEVLEGSKNSAFFVNMPSMASNASFNSIASKVFVFEYYERPESPEEAFEDILKLILYTGALVLCEANAPYVATRLMEEGLGNYMLVKDENGIITPWQRWMGMQDEKDKKYQLIRVSSNSQSSKGILEDLVRVIKNYLEIPIKGEIDYGKSIRSERFLKKCMDFDATDTKLSDEVMAGGYALLGLEIYLGILLSFQENYYTNTNLNTVLAAFTRD